jgi:outer membrane phospholipase A
MKKSIVCLFLILWAGVGLASETGNNNVKEGEPTVTEYDSFESLFTLYQPYLDNITAYKPIYFLMGVDPEDSRFQISLKYQLFSQACPLALCKPWLTGIQLGYTQTSSWDLESDSAPFEDTSYKPEVFFRTTNLSFRPGFLKGMFLKAGILHESNGQADERSRSTNYLYLKPIGIMYNEESGLGLQIAPKFTAYFNNSDSTNPDLDKYRGQLELELKVGKSDGIVLDSFFRFASEGESVQLDLTYPISLAFFSDLSLYLHAQYVDVLAETLLNYKERTEAIRVGIALVR